MSARGVEQSLDGLLAVRRWDDVISMASTALATDPQNASLHAYLSAAYLGAGRAAEALKAADNAAREAPEMEWAHRLRARALADLGKPKQALAAAQDSFRLEPQNRSALQVLAVQQMAVKRWADAEVSVAELIKIAPEWAESFNTRGRLNLRRRRPVQAEADFRMALRLAPDEPAYMNNLGAALQARGKRKEAIAAFQNAATTDPNFATARQNLFGSANRYLWGGGMLFLVSIAIRVAYVSANPGERRLIAPLVAVFLILAIPVYLLMYWLRKRSLNPVVRTFYEVEARRTRRKVVVRGLVKVGGALLLLGGFVAALAINQFLLAGLALALAILWIYRSATIWRYASRWFSR